MERFADGERLRAFRRMLGIMSHPESVIKQLYDLYADPIYRFIYWQTSDPLVAEDLTSEVFFKAWKHRDTLQNGNQRAWLYKVARNLVIDYYRRNKELALPEEIEIESDFDIQHEAERNESKEHVHAALAKLSLEDRTIVVLRYFEQQSAKDVAAVMDTTEGNIRVLQHRALKKLRNYIIL